MAQPVALIFYASTKERYLHKSKRKNENTRWYSSQFVIMLLHWPYARFSLNSWFGWGVLFNSACSQLFACFVLYLNQSKLCFLIIACLHGMPNPTEAFKEGESKSTSYSNKDLF